MAEMLASIKVLPTEAGIDLEPIKKSIKNSLPRNVKLYKVVEEPIAFGLVSLIVHLILNEDDPRSLEGVEESLKLIKSVGEIQVIGMTRLG